MPKNYEEESSAFDKKFLQLELFDPMREQEDLRQLVNQMRNPTDLRCYGCSNWVYNDGKNPEMRPCEVIEFFPKK